MSLDRAIKDKKKRDEDMITNETKTLEQEQTAKNIINALGNGKFRAMTGAHSFGYIDNGIVFKYPRAKHCHISYDSGLDLFDMKFTRFSKLDLITEKEYKGLYIDQLGEIFASHTGLAISL